MPHESGQCYRYWAGQAYLAGRHGGERETDRESSLYQSQRRKGRPAHPFSTGPQVSTLFSFSPGIMRRFCLCLAAIPDIKHNCGYMFEPE